MINNEWVIVGHRPWVGDYALLLLKGEFFHAIDSKGRVTIPAKLREAIDPAAEGEGFVGVRSFDDVLYLYTPNTYQRLAPVFDSRMQTNPDVRNFMRVRYAAAEDLEVDSLGRVLVSDKLLKRCGLSKEVAVIGVQDHVEIWDRARWDAYVREQLRRHDELADRAMKLQEERPAPAADSTT